MRSMHEMGEMKRAPELQVDEFYKLRLRESHETKQRLTSQVQELPEKMNYLNDSGEFQEGAVLLLWLAHTNGFRHQGHAWEQQLLNVHGLHNTQNGHVANYAHVIAETCCAAGANKCRRSHQVSSTQPFRVHGGANT